MVSVGIGVRFDVAYARPYRGKGAGEKFHHLSPENEVSMLAFSERPSPRVEHWLACAQKSCCSYFSVFATGDDVARIARTLAVPPWHFVSAVLAPHDADDAFALDASETRFRLALLRQRFAVDEPPSCTFVTRLPDAVVRCGLGDGRPLPCLSFPLVPASASSPGADFSGCTCDWSGVALDDADGSMHLRRLASSRERYRAVIERWNGIVAATGDAAFEPRDFLRFVMDAYA